MNTDNPICDICMNRLDVKTMAYCEDCTQGCDFEDLIDFFHQPTEQEKNNVHD